MGHILVPLVKICFVAIKSERIEWNFACVTFSLLTFSRKPQPTFVCTFQNTIKAFVKCSKLCRECANIVLYWSVQHRSYCWKIITTFEKWHLIVINPRDDGTQCVWYHPRDLALRLLVTFFKKLVQFPANFLHQTVLGWSLKQIVG